MTQPDRRKDVNRAVSVLRAGGLIGLPTETVYGLAADASNEVAVRRIFSVKGRPADHPLIVHISGVDAMSAWATQPSRAAQRLAEACWPGPLTMLVTRAPGVHDVVTGGRSTIGLRVPAHPLALAVLREFGGGLAAPSANRFGKVSPTTAEHVRADLGDDVDFVLDGGPCTVGVESTIVDCTVDPPQVLRPGAVSAATVRRIIDEELDEAHGPSRASGMLPSHYAPRCAVEVVSTIAEAEAVARSATSTSPQSEVLDLSHDAPAAARDLYELLRSADRRGINLLVVVEPAGDGIAEAVRDRLRKAAAPRS